MALETVTGLTWWRSVRARVDGRRAPGARRRAAIRSSLARTSVLVSLPMRDKDSATIQRAITLGTRP